MKRSAMHLAERCISLMHLLQSNDVNRVCRHPDFNLLNPQFQFFLEFLEELAVFGQIWSIDNTRTSSSRYDPLGAPKSRE
jgi:hypothetical protein